MDALEDARAALDDSLDEYASDAVVTLDAGLRAAIAEIERLTAENEKLRKQRNTAHDRSVRKAQALRYALRNLLTVVEDEPYDPDDIWYSPAAESFVSEAKTIQAIKQMRDDNPGLSLGEAKRYIDEKRAQWVSKGAV